MNESTVSTPSAKDDSKTGINKPQLHITRFGSFLGGLVLGIIGTGTIATLTVLLLKAGGL